MIEIASLKVAPCPDKNKELSPINSYIVVEFEPVPTVSGIVIPETYKIQDGDEDTPTAYGVTTDRRMINPQTVKIIEGTHKGRRAFVYYGAYEIASWPEPELAIIPERTILFLLDPIEPVSGTYLGEEVFVEGARTASGIFITPYAEKKEGIKIKLIHVCKNSKYNAGDMAITIDANHYPLTLEGKKYIKLVDREIVGVERDGKVIPSGTNLLVEYIPDDDLAAIMVENKRRAGLRDFMNKNGLYFTQTDLAPLDEPKTVIAKVLFGERYGKRVLIFRNHGCILPDKTWIINTGTIIGFID